ncbi:CrcB family protein [Salinibacterium sp. NG22]|uniref:fluoride efflux transporter FluC n=1 Tax=Salinibacterium sp. NG22 TaxID=2792040 RepID=UPI0018CEAF12|nr:CrcB family protein [Salinibacterium sp. NG22]MBH0110374.1 CrcB family protein [Salinibacterium sp. NG22]
MIIGALFITVAGGLGAALRLAVNAFVHRRIRTNYPVAMSIINISGSFLFGLITGMTAGHFVPEELGLYAGVGMVGGFTAFSTTSFQTLRLLQENRVWLAIANSFGMLAVAVLMAALGLMLGRAL